MELAQADSLPQLIGELVIQQGMPLGGGLRCLGVLPAGSVRCQMVLPRLFDSVDPTLIFFDEESKRDFVTFPQTRQFFGRSGFEGHGHSRHVIRDSLMLDLYCPVLVADLPHDSSGRKYGLTKAGGREQAEHGQSAKTAYCRLGSSLGEPGRKRWPVHGTHGFGNRPTR